jgi:hypothetical protein
MPTCSDPVHLELDGVELDGLLSLPKQPSGLVLLLRAAAFEQSELDDAVAHNLNEMGVGSLEVGLLTPAEASDELLLLELRFDIALLARRVIAVIRWIRPHLPPGCCMGLFATDTAGAAALVAASKYPELVDAVALLRGRPDLAVSAAAHLLTPTLLIAGGRDEPGIHWNEIGASHLLAPHEIRTVPGAGQFFAEGGSRAVCADLTSSWFLNQFASGALSQVG